MFYALVGEKKVKINVFDVANKIDDVLHKELTEKTGITVDHDDIARFVIAILNKNNKEEERLTKKIKETEEVLKKKEEQLKKKADNK